MEFRSTNPSTGGSLRSYLAATPAAVAHAVGEAAAAFHDPLLQDPDRRAAFLRTAAAALRGNEGEIVTAGVEETGLAGARLSGELERTASQLEAFAALIEAGDYVGAYVDPPDPEALPIPRPDVRRMLIPIGPVAVFGASNFPLAFSVAGGDTASALAAGCPAVIKGHPAHPGTGELVAAALTAAVVDSGLPPGTFAHLPSPDATVGEDLARRPEIAAIAFTGSFAAGRALTRLAAARSAPIPVFAEMGSVNPFVVSPDSARVRAEEIARGLVGAITGSAGQLCTKPGLIFVPVGEHGDGIAATVGAELSSMEPQVMLSAGIRDSLAARVEVFDHLASPLGPVATDAEGGGFRVRPRVFSTDARSLMREPQLREESFGPVAIFVSYADARELGAALAGLGGQLTATLHLESGELPFARRLMPILERISGRLIFNGYPTGVSVTHAMHHGGPYPATSNAAHTSVGMTAIARFLRPVAFQDAPPELLPEALRDGNPRKIWRHVDGLLTDG